MLHKRKKNNSKKQKNKAKNHQISKFRQSNGVRLAVALTFLTGVLAVVSGTGAQRPFFGENEAKNKSLKAEATGKTAKRTPNFDIRLGGEQELSRVLQKSSLADVNEAIRLTALGNKSAIEAGFEELKAASPKAKVEGSVLTGAVEIVRNPEGLTKAAPGRAGEGIVHEFLSANKSL
jgi:hypothetical protein